MTTTLETIYNEFYQAYSGEPFQFPEMELDEFRKLVTRVNKLRDARMKLPKHTVWQELFDIDVIHYNAWFKAGEPSQYFAWSKPLREKMWTGDLRWTVLTRSKREHVLLPTSPGWQDGECVYCYKDTEVVIIHPWGKHCTYCKPCINKLWTEHYNCGRILEVETPICEFCGFHMNYDDWKECFDDELLALAAKWIARSKSEEYRTPIDERLYCSKSTCSQFLGAHRRFTTKHKSMTCESCTTTTCVTCRQGIESEEIHAPLCQPERQNEELREVLKESDTQECPKCYNIITRTSGCSDMKCACGCRFCLDCGKERGDCKCREDVMNEVNRRAREIRDLLAGF
jgi:hypothetical protein